LLKHYLTRPTGRLVSVVSIVESVRVLVTGGARSGCKENQFSSLSFGQAVTVHVGCTSLTVTFSSQNIFSLAQIINKSKLKFKTILILIILNINDH
jgi:hypothetical protein